MKTAVVFAGQGAQKAGMGRDLAAAYPECRALFDQAGQALGYDLARLCFEGPDEELTRSDRAQPAIFVASAACWHALKREAPGFSPAGFAGLSLGEWTALYAAGVLSFADTVRVLESRGRFMQEACERQEGGMVSVMGLGVEALEGIARQAGVQVANFNSPEQIVLSGTKAGIAEAEKLAAAAGAKRTFVLKVAGAFHSRLMAPAAGRLEQSLGSIEFRPPSVPVVSNVTGRPHGAPDEIRRAMLQQITSSVQWVSCVEWFRGDGVTRYVECGPGNILSGLIKRIDKAAAAYNIADQPSLTKVTAALRAETAAA